MLRAANDQSGRLLLVETSSLARFDTARAFYRSSGFIEEARIRDFYAVGDHKLVLRKSLSIPDSDPADDTAVVTAGLPRSDSLP